MRTPQPTCISKRFERWNRLASASTRSRTSPRPVTRAGTTASTGTVCRITGIRRQRTSCWEGKRFFVPSDTADFLAQPVQRAVLEDAQPCTPEEQIMLGMRLTEGIPAHWLAGKQTEVERFCRLGFLRCADDRISMTPEGFLVSNTILAELLG